MTEPASVSWKQVQVFDNGTLVCEVNENDFGNLQFAIRARNRSGRLSHYIRTFWNKATKNATLDKHSAHPLRQDLHAMVDKIVDYIEVKSEERYGGDNTRSA